VTGPVPNSSDLDRFAGELNGRLKHGDRFDDQRAGASRTLERERDRYSTLFHSAPDPYLVTDRTGTIEEVNAAAAVLFGVPGSLLAKRSLADSIEAGARDDFRARLDGLIRSGRTDKWLLALESRDGRIIPVEATVAVAT
jgi:PAS domain S-box-containing protein